MTPFCLREARLSKKKKKKCGGQKETVLDLIASNVSVLFSFLIFKLKLRALFPLNTKMVLL